MEQTDRPRGISADKSLADVSALAAAPDRRKGQRRDGRPDNASHTEQPYLRRMNLYDRRHNAAGQINQNSTLDKLANSETGSEPVPAAPSTEPTGYWWCPNCKEELAWHHVTYGEHCETCGHPVKWIELVETPAPESTMPLSAEQINSAYICSHADCFECNLRRQALLAIELGQRVKWMEDARDEGIVAMQKLDQQLAEKDKEITRLTACLIKANCNHEEFERRYYLEQDAREKAEADVMQRINDALQPTKNIIATYTPPNPEALLHDQVFSVLQRFEAELAELKARVK